MKFKITKRVIAELPPPEPPPAVSRGLGDTVARVTHATGIARATHWLGLPCRCAQLQEALNKAIPYGQRTDDG